MTSYTSTITRLQGEIAAAQKHDAQEAKKEAELTGKVARALDEANRAKQVSVQVSKLKNAERYQRELATVLRKRGEYRSKIASKSKDLHSYQERQSTEDERSRKKVAEEQKRLIREREDHERRVTTAVRSRSYIKPAEFRAIAPTVQYDFFISHASEDKDSFVRALAEELSGLGAKVFYDEFTLKVDYSLRREIDRGLANSRFGVVVLSEYFFKKEWPARELDGLVTQEVAGKSRILPIWHKVSKDEVATYSPTLADKVALNTSTRSVKDIASELRSLLD